MNNQNIGGLIASRGLIIINLSPVETQALKPDKYQYELKIKFPNGKDITYLKGFFRILVDQDVVVDDTLIIGNREIVYLLPHKHIAASSTVNNSNANNGNSETTNKIDTVRLFYKTPSGQYLLQYMNDKGVITWEEDSPSRYPHSLIVLPPVL